MSHQFHFYNENFNTNYKYFLGTVTKTLMKCKLCFLILQANYFKSDVINRGGMSSYLMKFSDKMWEKGLKIMHFMLHRGTEAMDFEPVLKLFNVQCNDTNGEVKALAHTLDILKTNANHAHKVYKHAENKHERVNGHDESYDPTVIVNFPLKKLNLCLKLQFL